MLPADSRRSRRWQMGGASSASAARLIAVSIRPRLGLGVRPLTKLCAVMTLIYCAMQQQIPMSSVIDSAQEERLTRSCRVTSRPLQLICKDKGSVIRFRRDASDGDDHGCEGDFGKEICCAAERRGTRATRSVDTKRQERSPTLAEGADIVEGRRFRSR